MKILHVTECFDGGVSRAILAMVRNSPQYDHAILYDGSETPVTDFFAEVHRLPKGLIRRTRSVGQLVDSWGADVVHAHSSWAGVYARFFRQRVPVVYEPHCFVFDDPARPRGARAVYWVAESALSGRSTKIVTLTPHERRLAQSLSSRVKTADLVNVPSLRVGPGQRSTLKGRAVTMIGRLAPQKDPHFFSAVARLVHAELPEVQFVWIGDGDIELRRDLESAGVEVTGWLGAEDIVRRLADTRIYLHSASYEGFPLSVLDAAEAHVPLIVRGLPCFEGLDLTKVASVDQAAETIIDEWQNMNWLARSRERSESLALAMHPEVQARQLDALYQAVCN